MAPDDLRYLYYHPLLPPSSMHLKSQLVHSIISLIIDLPPRCSRSLRTVCCLCWQWRVPFKSQGEASMSCVGGECAADHEACILKPLLTAEVKHTRLSLQSRLPWESLRREKRFTQQLEKKRGDPSLSLSTIEVTLSPFYNFFSPLAASLFQKWYSFNP